MSARSNNTRKLGTFEGVFIPTTLNVLSILIYLRFGFIVGQAGILGSLGLLCVSYTINLLTTLSVSAIATNGHVKGGGAYYMISRSLGPEFGGSIGLVFYLGQIFNAALNVAGFSDPLIANFGESAGKMAKILPDSHGWQFVYQTLLLVLCTLVCLSGPNLFARSSKFLYYVLLVATLAIPTSLLLVRPFYLDEFEAWYTGPSIETLKDNLLPHLTKGAAGSSINGKETFKDLFGVSFSATAGVLAGASMSGDLDAPSRSIPKGSLSGLLVTFLLYVAVVFSLGCSASRQLLWRDVDVISDIGASSIIVMLGEFSTCIFSALMGVFGAGTLLQAISADKIIPFIDNFSGGRGPENIPTRAILLTYVLTQVTIFLPLNSIAGYVTMTFLMTFVVLNFACFALKIAAAPNFRPSFKFFNIRTAFAGFAFCVCAMLITDLYAALTILMVGFIAFVVIHSHAPPKPWGDVSQSLIYHQVRKYLLIMKQNHVKYWRPQILLLVDDPRSGWKLIRFCNFLKKGSLFILGHVVIVNREEDFRSNYPEISKQRAAWEKIRDMHHIKAFFQICASPSVVWGVRNVFLGSGLGGMKPNLTVVGFYDELQSGQCRDFVDVQPLPTDDCRKERHLSLCQWVEIIEDLITMGSDVCIAQGFMDIDLPGPSPIFKWPWSKEHNNHGVADPDDESSHIEYIDLYPIQMSAQLMDANGNVNGTSINLDTYTLILQLGSVLQSVRAWKRTHCLRVIAFVERTYEIEREKMRITELLDSLRITATIVVASLEENNTMYDVIVKGSPDISGEVTRKLSTSQWWSRLCETRNSAANESSGVHFDEASRRFVLPQVIGKRKRTFSSLQSMGVAHSMQSTRWAASDLSIVTEDSSSESEEENEDETDDESLIRTAAGQSTGNDNRTGSADELALDEELETDIIPATTRTSARLPSDDFDPCSQKTLKSHPIEVDNVHNFAPYTDEEQAQGHNEAGPSFQDDPVDISRITSRVEGEYHGDTENSTKAVGTGASHDFLGGASLSFNQLPARAQHLIINNLMKRVSNQATVIFTTLPAPPINTHRSQESSLDYHSLLRLLCDGLPPIAMVHAQSMTVTTDL